MNKDLIKQRFNKKLDSYEENATIQNKMAEKLITFLPCKKFNSVLEIGCGTGFLTKYAAENLCYNCYEALDIVSKCENYIKKIDSEIKFVSADVEEYIDNNNKKYDLILSNASVQWIENLPEFVTKLVRKLNNNGKLLFSTFGTENFREIYYTLGKTLSYYSVQELQIALSEFNPVIQEEIHVMAFNTPKDVLKHIQKTGVNALSAEVWTKKDLIDFENGYNNFCSNKPTLTYNPIYVFISADKDK